MLAGTYAESTSSVCFADTFPWKGKVERQRVFKCTPSASEPEHPPCSGGISCTPPLKLDTLLSDRDSKFSSARCFLSSQQENDDDDERASPAVVLRVFRRRSLSPLRPWYLQASWVSPFSHLGYSKSPSQTLLPRPPPATAPPSTWWRNASTPPISGMPLYKL